MRINLQYLINARRYTLLLFGVLAMANSFAMGKPYPGPFFESDQLLVVLIPRAPEQMAAFYEARGFPQNAIDLITAACFVTVHIENRSQQVIWLETGHWKLSSKDQALSIMGTGYWDKKWAGIDLPQANRSTFFWTQLPAIVDLQPDEPVGGNIVVPGDVSHFNIEANFMTGQDRQGEKIQIRFTQVECLKQVPAR